MTAPLRWGLLGAGWISRRAIAPAIHSAEGACLAAVAARDLQRAQALSPAALASTSYGQVVDSDEVDAVYIALSNDAHLPWAMQAIEAGKPVICEKPLGCNASESRRMRAAAKAHDVLLVEATWNVWHPRTRRAHALLLADAIGALKAVSGAFVFDGVAPKNYRLDPHRGGGALLDVGCYPLTAAAWAIDSAGPVAVEKAAITLSDSGVDLTADAHLRVASIPVHVRASFIEPARQSLVLEGSHGLIEFTGSDAYTSWLQPSSLRVTDRDGERVEHFPPVDPYRLMIENVTRHVRGESAYLPDPRWSLIVAEAMDLVLAHPPT